MITLAPPGTPPRQHARGDRYPAHAILGSALMVLSHIAHAGQGGMTVPRLVRRTGRTRQWLHRVLRVLELHVPSLEVRLRGAPKATLYRLRDHTAWCAVLAPPPYPKP